MRLPLLLASFLVVASVAYKYYAKDITPTGKTVFSWSFVLIALGILEQTTLQPLSSTFLWVIILIILLNDGYDIARSI